MSKNTKTFFIVGGIIAVIGLYLLLGSIAGFDIPSENTSPKTETSENVPQKQEYATLEKFEKVQIGMSYEEVCDIMEFNGTLTSESAYGDYKMQIYSWYGKDKISNTTISFTNNEVSAKSQIGLK